MLASARAHEAMSSTRDERSDPARAPIDAIAQGGEDRRTAFHTTDEADFYGDLRGAPSERPIAEIGQHERIVHSLVRGLLRRVSGIWPDIVRKNGG